MTAINLLHHIPEIEQKIIEHDLDSIVLAIGPSGYLAPFIDSELLRCLDTWGSHDICKIGLHTDDLLLIDSPSQTSRLMPGTDGYQKILESRPRRLWIFKPWWDEWMRHLPKCVHSIATPVPFWVWGSKVFNKGLTPPGDWRVGDDPPHCGGMSPIACITLAWWKGARRIGVLGMDLGPEHKHTHKRRKDFDKVACKLAASAHSQGGCVVNLSPITYLRNFEKWTPPTSG